MPFVLDASVAMGWSFRDERNAYAHGVLRRLRADSAMVPAVWVLEVANGLLVAERRGRFSPADIATVCENLGDLPVEVVDVTFDQAMSTVLNLGRTEQLSAYDATYLDLAMRERLPLATQDDRLWAAAGRVGVELIE